LVGAMFGTCFGGLWWAIVQQVSFLQRGVNNEK
jgi:hypothetical protein